jgi:DUF4097 and DUF4098 domain-containing protein YvlB
VQTMTTSPSSGFPGHAVVARAFVLLAGVLLVSLPGFANSNEVYNQSFKLSSGGHFQLDNVNGSVQVEGWDRDEVEVQAVKTASADSHALEDVKIEVESTPGTLAVHTHYPSADSGDVAVEYHIHVPNKTLLACVTTVNGSLSVRGVNSGGDLKSVNGNVEVTDSSGRFSAKTTNGDVHVELRKLNVGNMSKTEAPMNVETVNGSVILGLPSNASADLKVRNTNGDLYSDFPVSSLEASTGGRAFHGRIGHGGGPISVRTVNGGIRLLLEHPGV